MRFLNIFLVFAIIFAVAYAAPQLSDESSEEMEPRITCDIIGGEWGDRACAAHCLGEGYRGGYCNSQKVCVCRN